MDPDGDSQPTQQATQNVVDPRRLGKQNSGFSDEEISDIICLLLPASESARKETKRIASDTSHPMIARHNADGVDLDYTMDDEVGRLDLMPHDSGKPVIVLRLSDTVKDPLQGFTFGRNPNRCDICFVEDPLRRLSNIHFRIYLNEYGVLMLEDQSTNGTVVDDNLLRAKFRPTNRVETKRTLSSGSKVSVLMHKGISDLVFYVRIPRREGEYEQAYRKNLIAYMSRLKTLADDKNQTIGPGAGGHVDLFPNAAQQPHVSSPNFRPDKLLDETTQHNSERLPLAWNGSDKYNRVAEIGKGAFATVYKVTSKFDGHPYAAKELDKRRFVKNGVLDQKVENEMKIMQKVKHPNIVRYMEHLDWDNRLLIIIMEFVPGGDLGRLIHDRGPLSEAAVKIMASQLLAALGYLHQNNITHRDVKPDNILIGSQQPFVVKLTDFGLSKMVDNENTFLRTFCGTLLYCAPEVYSEFAEYDDYGRRNPRHRHRRAAMVQRYDHAVDVWSLGGVLFYALTGSPPYPVKTGVSYSELLHQIMTKRLDIAPLVRANVSAEGIDFLTLMLQRRPESRATVQDLLQHRWVGGNGSQRRPGDSQSFDDFSEDDVLEHRASQLSIEDEEEERQVLGTEDDAVDFELHDENDDPFESQKENYTFGPPGGQHIRLFGEVDMSAIGSSGAIPEDRLNLPVSVTSFATTQILGSEVGDSYGSDDLSTPQQQSKSQPASGGGVRLSSLSAGKSRSVDQLNNLTFDVSSQDLGGAESILENLNMKSLAGSHLRESRASDVNTSKRKPSFDMSDEFEESVVRDRPIIKRIKSEGLVESPSDSGDGEYELFARMPSLARLLSGRQIDSPVHKATYWTVGNRESWHLRYPEMTQLQLDAFRSAAQARGEEFLPGKTPLWDMAWKYFPPIHLGNDAVEEDVAESPILGDSIRGKQPTTTGNSALASTAYLEDTDSLPDTQLPEQNIVIPIRAKRPANRVVASLHSAPDSAVPGISVTISESMISWGRASNNTRVYTHKSEVRVPKYAFKIVLWREDYEPSRNFRPWVRSPTVSQGDSFYFYISTKATHGILVNDFSLASHDCRDTHTPSRNWLRLYDGDTVTVWRSTDSAQRTRLVFRCDWGGSARPRPAAAPVSALPPPAQMPDAAARQLDDACLRAERRLHNLTEHDLRMEEADHDVDVRFEAVERERQLSRAFERRRAEACRVLALRQSRKGSPVSASAAAATSVGASATLAGVGGAAAGGNGELLRLSSSDVLGVSEEF